MKIMQMQMDPLHCALPRVAPRHVTSCMSVSTRVHRSSTAFLTAALLDKVCGSSILPLPFTSPLFPPLSPLSCLMSISNTRTTGIYYTCITMLIMLSLSRVDRTCIYTHFLLFSSFSPLSSINSFHKQLLINFRHSRQRERSVCLCNILLICCNFKLFI